MQDTITIWGLEPMIEPEAVANWPPAPGWYLVIALVVIALSMLVFRSITRWRRDLYRREALQKLELIRQSRGEKIRPEDLGGLNRVLKITAIHRYSREKVAPLSGSSWLDFLKEGCPELDFTKSPGNLLAYSGYLNKDQVELSDEIWNQLISLVEKWIRKHR